MAGCCADSSQPMLAVSWTFDEDLARGRESRYGYETASNSQGDSCLCNGHWEGRSCQERATATATATEVEVEVEVEVEIVVLWCCVVVERDEVVDGALQSTSTSRSSLDSCSGFSSQSFPNRASRPPATYSPVLHWACINPLPRSSTKTK